MSIKSLSLISRALGVVAIAALATTATPAVARAQKALVYCPAAIDATGCDNVVSALTTAFPDGVDRGYDGTAGTVDLKTVDLFAYSVFVVPSLADDSTSAPYGLLRDPAVATRLKSAIMGRLALWSGTPDQGTTNRDLKNALITNLTTWAKANFAAVKGPGLVAFQDLSDSVSARYAWLRGVAGLTITADSAVNSYASVRAVTATATTILNNGGTSAIAYTNMASLGFYLPQGAAGMTLDAVGQTGTDQGGQIVLMTSPGGNSGSAVIKTDKSDYAPGTTVTITGSGFQPGETVTMTLTEDPNLDQHPAFTSVADTNGAFVNTSFSPDAHDVSVRFLLAATGGTSGVQAQTTFTDGSSINNGGVTVAAQTPSTVIAGGAATYVVSVVFKGTGSCAVGLRVSQSTPLPAGATASFSPSALTGDNNTLTSTLTIGTAPSVPGGATNFDVLVQGSGPAKADCTSSNTNVTGSASLTVAAPIATTLHASSSSATYSPAAQSIPVSATVSPAGANAGTVTFTVKDGSNNTVGSPTTPATVTSGSASASYTLPGGTPAATYGINADYTGGDGFAPSSGTASLVVGKADQATVTVSTSLSTVPYNGQFQATAVAGSGTGAYSYSASGVCSVNSSTGSAQMTSGTGTCSITAARAGDTNYNPSANSAPATVTAALATQAPLAVTGVPTTAQPFNASFTVAAVGGTGTGALTFAATGACTIDAISGVAHMTSGTGTCSITAAKGGDTNYASVTSSAAAVAAAKADQSILWSDPAPIAYGTSLSGVLNATLAVGDGTLSYGNTATDILSAGSHTLTATASATSNYNLATKSVTLTVNKANLTATIVASGKAYDGSTAATVTSCSVATRIGSDDVGCAASAAAFGSANAGAQTVTATIVLTGADAGNYTVASTVTTTADITPASLTISANASSKVYGDPNPTFGVTYSSFVAGENNSALAGTLGFTTAADVTTGVGQYDVTPNGLTSGNYNITFAPGKLTISPTPLTITAGNNTRVYGDGNPAFTGTLLGLKNNDGITASYSTTATSASDVGGYAIVPVPVDASPSKLNNYSVTLVNGSLTITAAPLTVVVDAKSKVQGDLNPTLTGTVSGIKNSDNVTAVYSTPAVVLSPPGQYPIVATLSDPNFKLPNYSVTNPGGVLIVTANAAPSLGVVTGPTGPAAVNTSVSVSATFTDVDVSASFPYSTTIDWGDGNTPITSLTNTPGAINGLHSYSSPGVYTVKISVSDKINTTPISQSFQYIVVYDPSAGFVTGGGWISSPTGACRLSTCAADGSTVGKATFGFNAA